ncbi:hypothetical protein GSI_04971 [Ganoderma sinense ZZ0214-1]|uniref:Uncharacterized protein n=1 Tax=Ganoderma sinense ZZ0214-1 TaxID=1077348 RepID=A0A2G8SGF5_9APHY|nr:hypothetical protein GSI_04971 [Ganoderma sinense ZZ0214-1]
MIMMRVLSLIRINDEARLFWGLRKGQKPPIAVLTYALSRYAPIIQFSILAGAGLLSILSPTIFSTLRVYALSGGNRVLATIAFLFCCVPFGINMMNELRSHLLACSTIAPTRRVTIASRTSLITGDLIVLLVTWMNTYTVCRVKRAASGGQSIVQVMLYNGCFCFIVITSMNTAQMVIATLKIQSVLNICGYVNLFITPITSLLICHFLLDLHNTDSALAYTSSPTDISPVQFAVHRSSPSMTTLSSSAESTFGDDDPLHCREHAASGALSGGTESLR